MMDMPASRRTSRATTVHLDWPTREENEMTERVRFSAEEARHVGEEIGKEFPDYYTRLARMEDEARRDSQGPYRVLRSPHLDAPGAVPG